MNALGTAVPGTERRRKREKQQHNEKENNNNNTGKEVSFLSADEVMSHQKTKHVSPLLQKKTEKLYSGVTGLVFLFLPYSGWFHLARLTAVVCMLLGGLSGLISLCLACCTCCKRIIAVGILAFLAGPAVLKSHYPQLTFMCRPV